MTHLKKIDTGKLCLILMSYLLPCSYILGQDYQTVRQKALDKLDLTGFKNVLFMNAAVTTPHEIAYLKSVSKGLANAPTPVSVEEWHNLYQRLLDADLRDHDKHIPRLEQLMETNPSKLTRNDTIPIGVIDLEAIYLTDKELRDNETRKMAGRAANFLAYDKFRIIYVAALQQDIYQADVWFKISSKFFISNHSVQTARIALDFGDGLGFQSCVPGEQSIHHRFNTIGRHSINIKIVSESINCEFQTYVDVRQLDRVPPSMEFHASAPILTIDSTLQNARTQVAGATIRIINGCDAVLDKAVIVAEGFDMANDQNLDVLEGRFRTPLSQWLSEGYDLVLVDYDDA
ncbi:hypothetical protein GCM10010967_13550 [Dyadobacter beijingensis]|uniref:Uncharacterized protein n=1 Tax=Dyadobacter beijingensis TaxID=365489 RepID=A0ABQ2HKP4_9BACT|nr:hypothetical protein [Dyadobacter beijingensis]GGM83142.1 hypothetical protein GCM10010967_13550 [Dyadobacter beijingensis]